MFLHVSNFEPVPRISQLGYNIADYYYLLVCIPSCASGKEPAHQCRSRKRHVFDPWARKIPWRKKWQPSAVFLPGEFHGQRNVVGSGP